MSDGKESTGRATEQVGHDHSQATARSSMSSGGGASAGMMGMMQGMLGSMQGGQPGSGFNFLPTHGGLMQSMTSSDGINTTTTVGMDPSMAAHTTKAFDPATNTLTTTTVDPVTGATTTTMTSSTTTGGSMSMASSRAFGGRGGTGHHQTARVSEVVDADDDVGDEEDDPDT